MMHNTLDLKLNRVSYCLPVVALPLMPGAWTHGDLGARPCSQEKRWKAREKRRLQKLRKKQGKH